MENILVLGSRGQIGLSLTRVLSSYKKFRVIECDIVCDQSNDLRRRSLFLDESFQKADFVYFLAYDVGGSKYLKENQNSSDFLNNNLLLMLNTFSYLEKYSNPFIFASTQMSNMDTLHMAH